MRFIILFLIVGLHTCLGTYNELPEVAWLDCQEIEEDDYDMCMIVTFHDKGNEDEIDLIGLNYFDDYDTILEGDVLNEEGSVSVTIEDDVAEILLRDPSKGHAYMVSWNMINGEVEYDDLSDNKVKFDNAPIAPLEEDLEVRSHSSRLGFNNRALPSEGMTMNINLLWDGNFERQFGNEIDARAEALMVHVRHFFKDSTLKTTIYPQITMKNFIDGDFTATGRNLRNLTSHINRFYQSRNDIHSHTMLSYQNNQGGTIGIAWLKSTCSSSVGYRANINEWFGSNLRTAQIIVHEIGHNLGMYHDFEANGKPRLDKNNNPCINGFMDYGSNPYGWSTCSNEFFESYFDSYNNVGRWCMDLGNQVSGPTTPTNPVDPEVTTQKPKNCKNKWKDEKCEKWKPHCGQETRKGKIAESKCRGTCEQCSSCRNNWPLFCWRHSEKIQPFCNGDSKRAKTVQKRCQKSCGKCTPDENEASKDFGRIPYINF